MKEKSSKTIKGVFDKWDFQRHVLEVLVYFASEKGQKRLPTIEQFVLSEVVAATIEYLTGQEYLFTYHRSENGTEYIREADDWEWKTNKAMAETLERFGDKLNPALRKALKELTEIKFSSDAMGWKGTNSSLYTWYKHSICFSGMVSTFSLSVEFINEVEREVIPELGAKTIRHCQAIAELMKKYLERDFDLIKRKYHW